MENPEIKTQSWKNKEGEVVATVEVDDKKGIKITAEIEALGTHRKEMEELLTLGMYPPKDDEMAKGEVSEDGKWITYETKKGQRWDIAKVDMMNTFYFWFGELFGP